MTIRSPRITSAALALLLAGAAGTASADPSRWTVAGGIGLGSDYNTLIQGRANHNVEVAGWRPEEKRSRKVSGALRAYAALTTSASRGAVRDVSQVER